MLRFIPLLRISIILVVSSTSAIAETPTTSAPLANSGQEVVQNKITKNLQFGDWLLVCRAPNPSTPQSCEITQAFTLKDQKAPFAQIAIGKPRSDMPQQVTVVVPNNVSFPSSVRIAVDEKDKAPIDIAWARCIPGACFANAPLKEDIQKKWSAIESQGSMTFKAANGQNIVTPVSFKGLKGAIEALAKEK